MSDRHLRPDRPHRPLAGDHANPELDADGRFGRKPAEELLDEGVGEGSVLSEIAGLVSEGVLEPVPDDWEFVVTEFVAPGIEIGFSRRKSGACRYPAHREHDWFAEGGRVVCGICHPPPTVATKASKQ